jgi:two-component system catabolic regulation response regulator CreB
MGKPRILIVEDEPAIRDNIQFVLESEGLQTLHVGAGFDALPLLAQHEVNLVVLDVGLPDVNGFELLKQIRRQSSAPVIMLTARDAELDRVLGLELGADDYVVKPFSPRELAARVKAVLRRAPASPAHPSVSAAQQPGDHAALASKSATATPSRALVIDPAKRQVCFFGAQLSLSKLEYELLATFVKRPGQVFSREQLMTMIWEQPETSLERSVDAHIKNLRSKLRAVRPDIEAIITHRGSGYSLREDL